MSFPGIQAQRAHQSNLQISQSGSCIHSKVMSLALSIFTFIGSCLFLPFEAALLAGLSIGLVHTLLTNSGIPLVRPETGHRRQNATADTPQMVALVAATLRRENENRDLPLPLPQNAGSLPHPFSPHLNTQTSGQRTRTNAHRNARVPVGRGHLSSPPATVSNRRQTPLSSPSVTVTHRHPTPQQGRVPVGRGHTSNTDFNLGSLGSSVGAAVQGNDTNNTSNTDQGRVPVGRRR